LQGSQAHALLEHSPRRGAKESYIGELCKATHHKVYEKRDSMHLYTVVHLVATSAQRCSAVLESFATETGKNRRKANQVCREREK